MEKIRELVRDNEFNRNIPKPPLNNAITSFIIPP